MNRRQLLIVTATIPVAGLIVACDTDTQPPSRVTLDPALGPDGEFAGDPAVAIENVGPLNLQPGAPKLKVGVEPLEAGKANYLTLAPPVAGGAGGAKLVLRLSIANAEAQPVTVSGISLEFPGSAVPTAVMQGVQILIDDGNSNTPQSPILAPNEAKWWSNGRVKLPDDSTVSNTVYLSLPTPPSVRVAITCEGFPNPYRVNLPLAAYQGGFPFPLRAVDLRVGECLTASGSHWANGGVTGTQIYAHDIGVTGWDGSSWSQLLPGEDLLDNKLESWRAWNKPVRAVAAGTVLDVSDGLDDNPMSCYVDRADSKTKCPFPDPTPKPVTGNFVWIKHGGERVLYTHMRKGSITVQKGQSVSSGQLIGRVGNSGNTTNPHIHVEVRRDISGNPLRPWGLASSWLIETAAGTPWNPDSAQWVETKKRGIPNTSVLIWPAATRPKWYPPGWGEVSHHGVGIGGYQTVFDRATDAGYRLVWFDGYEVGGATFVNVVFRPKDGVAWFARHGMTSAQYQSEFDSRAAAGYRLINVTSYLQGGAVRYAAIWRKQGGPAWVAYHGLNTTDHQARFNTLTRQGYHPVNISIVSPGDQPQFTAFYLKDSVGSFVATSFHTLDQYQTAWVTNWSAGRQLAYLGACQHAGSVRVSAIFQQVLPGSGGTYGRHNLSSGQYQKEYDTQLGKGYLTRVVAGYALGSAHTYGAAWRKP